VFRYNKENMIKYRKT